MIVAALAACAAGALATACAVVSGLSSFERGLCEIDGCLDSGADATLEQDAGADADDREGALVDDGITPIEPPTCGGFTCKTTQQCCARFDGGGLGCPSTCNDAGIAVGCFRDTQCGPVSVCCGLAEELPNQGGFVVTSVECMGPVECTAYQVCDDGHPCQDDAGCVAPAPGAPRLCVLAPLDHD